MPNFPGTTTERDLWLAIVDRNCRESGACALGENGALVMCEGHRGVTDETTDMRLLRGLVLMRRTLASRVPGAAQRVVVA